MRAVLSLIYAERRGLREAASQRVRERYSWDAVTAAYERLFEHLLRRGQTA
jgi:glycosyltransferase involved in cell wall biosynthesis